MLPEPPLPTEQEKSNAAMRLEIADRLRRRYEDVISLIEEARIGKDFKPWMALTLIDADHRQSGNREPAAVVFEVYRGDERTSDNALFIRKMPDGRLLKDERYEPLFGDMLFETHPYKTMEFRGEQVPVPRYELCWGPLEIYRPRDAEQLAALRVSRERGKQERADRKWDDENPLLAWSEKVNREEGERGR